MISIKDQQKVYNIKWISRAIEDNDSKISKLANLICRNLGGIQYIIKSALPHPEHMFGKAVKNWFWLNAACSWSSLHHNLRGIPSSVQNILCQPLFLNSNIQYKKSSLIFQRWIRNNVLFICDILEENSLKSRNELVDSVGNYALLTFEHNALINALPEKWFSVMRRISTEDIVLARTNRWELGETERTILDMKNCEMRDHILKSTQFTKHNEQFWSRKLGVDISENYEIAKKSTQESKLRLLHFKIMHNIYPTNILLSKMKVKPSGLCETCQVPDYIEHFFFECSTTQTFWNNVNNFIRIKGDLDIHLNKTNILMGITRSDFPSLNNNSLKFINSIILIGKLSISKYIYGKIKNLSLIFENEYSLRYDN